MPEESPPVSREWFAGLLPGPLSGRRQLAAAVHNFGWLLLRRLLYIVVGVVVGAWVARSLGPRQYGMLSYAVAFVALLDPLSRLGIGQVVIRDLVGAPADASLILGTAAWLHLVGSLAMAVLAVLGAALVGAGQGDRVAFIAIVALSYLFSPLRTTDYWFQSQTQSKYVVLSTAAASLVIAAAKVLAILLRAPLSVLVCAVALEYALGSLFTVMVFESRSGQSMRTWRLAAGRARQMLHDSWPLVGAGIAAGVHAKIDQVMIGNWLGDRALGLYSVAANLSAELSFPAALVASSVFPGLLRARQKDRALYLDRLQAVLSLVLWIALATGAVVSWLSGWMVSLLYGPGFAGSAPLLAIYVWSNTFLAMEVVSARHLIAENLTRIALARAVAAAALNLGLNLVLLPRFGLTGAAAATLLSYGIGFWGSLFMFRRTRALGVRLLGALDPMCVVRSLREK